MPAGTSTTRRPRLRSQGQNTRPGRLRTLAGRSKCVQFAPTASFSSFAYAVSCGSHCVRITGVSAFIYRQRRHTHLVSHTHFSALRHRWFFPFHICAKRITLWAVTPYCHLCAGPTAEARGARAARRTGGERCAAPADPKTGHYDVKIPRRAGRTPRAPCRGCGLRPDQTLHGPRLLRGLHRDRARGQPT
jgi:hypothetical protein